MAEQIKVLTADGVKALFDLLSLQDYPNNDVLMAVINAIDTTKLDKSEFIKMQHDFAQANFLHDDSALKVSPLAWFDILNNVDHPKIIQLYYKVSDLVPTKEQIGEGFGIVIGSQDSINGGAYSEIGKAYPKGKAIEHIRDEEMGYSLIVSNNEGESFPMCVFVPEDSENYKKGTYFLGWYTDIDQAFSGVTVLKIQNYNFNTTIPDNLEE